MTIFFYKGLREIGNAPVWFLANIWRLGQIMGTKFGTNVSNRMLLNAAEFHVTTFTILELLRENQLGMEGKITTHPPPLPRLGLKHWTTIAVLKKFQIRLTNLAEF